MQRGDEVANVARSGGKQAGVGIVAAALGVEGSKIPSIGAQRVRRVLFDLLELAQVAVDQRLIGGYAGWCDTDDQTSMLPLKTVLVEPLSSRCPCSGSMLILTLPPGRDTLTRSSTSPR